MEEKPEKHGKPEKPCKIEVKIPKGTDVMKLEAAVNKALEAKLTDAVVESCEEITIRIVKFPR